jgi:hypothetical protein
MIQLTWQSIITASALLGAVTAIFTFILRVVRWFDRQKGQDIELAALRKKHDEELATLRGEHRTEIKEIKEEQTILTYGILACLKGLHEKGCNGPVTEAIMEIERHLNENAHK